LMAFPEISITAIEGRRVSALMDRAHEDNHVEFLD